MSDLFERLKSAVAERYLVECELGRGGMATVYLAQDLKHDRRVALKVLDPHLAATVGHVRFLREIEIAAKLLHPNILGLLDSGDAGGLLYYVMPYVEGDALSDRLEREEQLPMEDALQITREVADGLGYAHGMGVVHRDIKPENILLSGGHAVVADFGIAKAVCEAGGEKLTETGLAVGTPAYMSPEQSSGAGRIDGRSDVYSLGCVFYHMVVGEPPFTGPSAQAILTRHAIDPVSPLSTVRSTVPLGMDRAVAKALAKVPADRFSTAPQFAEALFKAAAEESAPQRSRGWGARMWVGISTVVVALVAVAGFVASMIDDPGIERLAVLPPIELAADPDQAAIVQGMYNALLTELGQAGVRVIGSLQSMMRYQNTDKTVAEIADELGVDAVIEPSVFWAGDSVGIGVRMIDGRTEESLWSRSYDADARNLIALYRQVTREIAGEIRLALTPLAEARLAAAVEVDPDAHQAYLQGRFYSGKLTAADLEIAIDYYNLALEKDPTYAPAYAGLSWAWVARQQLGYSAPSEATPVAIQAARRALELDSLLPEGHHALATAQGWAGWDWQVAESGLKRAIELNPAYGDARADYSHLLLVLKRFEESEAQADTALASDPFNVKFLGFRGVVYMNTLQREKGLAEVEKVMRAVPNNAVARSVLANVYHVIGQYEEAMNHITAMYAAKGIEDFATALRRDYEELGYHPAMRAAARRLEGMAEAAFVPPIMIASLYAYAGDAGETLSWLEKGFERREPNLPYIGVAPLYDFVRADPRFQTLLEGMNLPWALTVGS